MKHNENAPGERGAQQFAKNGFVKNTPFMDPYSRSSCQNGAGLRLDPRHRRMLEIDSAIPPEAAAATGYRTVEDKAELLELGFKDYQARVPGLLVPIWSPAGEIVSYQFRPDSPRLRDGKPVKYESLPDCGSRLHVPPVARAKVRDPRQTLVVTEGVRKADCAAGLGLACVALPGVWNWKARNEADGSVTVGDFENLPVKGRDVVLCFDSDAAKKQAVLKAERRLAGFLRAKGARVRVARIPDPGDGGKDGLDDFAAKGGDLRRLIAEAREIGPEDGEAGSERQSAVKDAIAVLEAALELWRTPDGAACATVAGQPALHRRVRSREFEVLARHLLRKAGRFHADATVGQALSALEGEALFEGPVYPTGGRIAWHDGACWLALHDAEGRVVRIGPNGWRVIGAAECPVRFVPSRSMLPLPEPLRGGSLDPLFEAASVPDSADKALIMAWLTGVFCPTGTRCWLQLVGPKGSGKSQVARVLRSLIDPSEAPVPGKWRESRDLDARLESSYILAVDNLRRLSRAEQDELCVVCNDAARTGRELYTNSSEVVVRTRRPVLSTSIEPVATEGDLADRTVTVRLEPLGEYLDEATLAERFEAARASVLGALLDRAARGLAGYRQVQVRHRLSDFARFALAACADEDEREALREALSENRRRTHAEAIEDCEFLAALVQLVRERGEVEATAAQLLEMLRIEGRKPPRDWPETPQAVRSLIDRHAPDLLTAGVAFERRRNNKTRTTVFRNILAKQSSPSSPSSPDPHFEPENGLFPRDDGRDDAVTMPFGSSRPAGRGDDAQLIVTGSSPGSSPEKHSALNLETGAGDDGDDSDDVFTKLSSSAVEAFSPEPEDDPFLDAVVEEEY